MSCSINVLPGGNGVDNSVYGKSTWPAWVPDAAKRYLAHTEAGKPIRALARENNMHPSTVLRQVRRTETLRDDPLVDAALRELAKTRALAHRAKMKDIKMTNTGMHPARAMTTDKIHAETGRVLRRMSETGAVLAIADGMDMGVVVRDDACGGTTRTAVVQREVAQAMALKEFISCDDPSARICRYRITAQGRSELRSFMAAEENGAQGFAEGQARFMGAQPVSAVRSAPVVDSPLAALARRKDKDGTPFLERALVAAGERLREDFELAQMDQNAAQDWAEFLTQSAGASQTGGTSTPSDAKARVAAALSDLGPGLGDVALRCCCYLEGMEATEKKMGWSARSGKIVLRIALQRLRRHYEDTGKYGPMIG